MQTSDTNRPCVLIASEVRLYREGLALFLNQDRRLIVFHDCASIEQILEILDLRTISAVLLDVGMNGALSFTNQITASMPSTKVLALGLNEVVEEIMPFVEAGAAGYVCRDATVDDVVKSVTCAINEELICSRRVAAALLRRISSLSVQVTETKILNELTCREWEIVELLDAGLSNKAIADHSNIALSTVKSHVHHIFEKLHARSRAEAAAKYRALRVLKNSQPAHRTVSKNWSVSL